ncbi:MAG: peptidoglycan-binding protein [Candidatus Vogelbacteria bacterium]|nr:peptidoglycan-binding protein [Candidatus Vogelbacteria bacterium]
MSNLKKSRIARITSGIVGLMTSIMMMGGVAVLPAAAADSAADLQAKIDALLSQINTLKGAAPAASAMPSFTFATTLKLGSKGADVMALQKALNADGEMVAASGAGSPGKESSNFGPATKRAVIKFQEKYASECLAPVGLTKGTGVVGALTRAKLNSLAVAAPAPAAYVPPGTPAVPGMPATVPAPGVSAAAGTLTVSGTASMQPAPQLAPASASRIPFTKFTLTAGATDVTVDNITVERIGASTDSAFAGVDLVDENGQLIGLEKTINSDHKSYVGNPFMIKAGTTRTLTIAATRAAAGTHGGEQAAFRVVAINTEGTVTLAGDALPILGATHTVNESLVVGTVGSFIAGPLSPTAQSKPIGTNGYIFGSIKFSAGSAEKMWLKSVRWNQAGSAGASDVANVKTYVDGTAYDTTVSSDGKYYTSIFGNGILMDKGASKEIYVQGDVVGGSGRTVSFDIYRTTDLVVTGDTYGYSVVPTAVATAGSSGVFTTSNPWWNAADVTVQSGTLNVAKSSAIPAQNVAINLANQPLGGFDIEVKGEPITVTSMNFEFSNYLGTGATANTQDLTDVKLVDSTGKVVAGPVDINASTGANPSRVPFTDSVTFPVGKNTYSLVGKVGTDFATNQTIAASTTASSWTATGQVTGNTITSTPSSAVTGNTMTVKAAVVTITNSAAPAAQTVVAGAQGYTFANLQLDASASGEDIRFSSLKASFTNGGDATFITGCGLYDGSSKLTSGSNEVNPTATGDSSFIFVATTIGVSQLLLARVRLLV